MKKKGERKINIFTKIPKLTLALKIVLETKPGHSDKGRKPAAIAPRTPHAASHTGEGEPKRVVHLFCMYMCTQYEFIASYILRKTVASRKVTA